MNPDAANLPPVASASAREEALARASLIRRSIRCLIFGAIGVIPFVGLGGAWVALRLQRQIATEIGDPFSFRPSTQCLSITVSLGTLCCAYQGFGTAVEVILGSLIIQFCLVRRAFRREPPRWNPARRLCYWGTALAITGITLALAVGPSLGAWKAYQEDPMNNHQHYESGD